MVNMFHLFLLLFDVFDQNCSLAWNTSIGASLIIIRAGHRHETHLSFLFPFLSFWSEKVRCFIRKRMAKEMPLLAELSNCLSAYDETFQRIMRCFASAAESTPRPTHESPIIIQVQDLLSIDAELKRHLQRKKEWESRQKRIEELESKLGGLSKRINQLATKLQSTEIALQGCLSVASKLQKDVMQNGNRFSFE